MEISVEQAVEIIGMLMIGIGFISVFFYLYQSIPMLGG